MKIQHNISALNTHRNLNFTNTQAGKALEKLSSGYKINRAGDDAAGLAISEKMRSQIRGLNMASKNAQDAISLIQTAEGALNEVHAMLQRARELSVQAANDTNVAGDRDALQQEVSQILQEINDIADRTEFNTMKVLKGGTSTFSMSTPDAASLSQRLANSMLGNAEEAVTQAYGLSPDKVSIEIKYENQGPGGWVAWVTSTGGNPSKPISLTIDEADFFSGTPLWIDADRVITHEMVHAVMSGAIDAFNTGDIPDWFKEGAAEYVAGGNERVRGENIANLITNNFKSIADSDGYAASFLAVKYMDDKLKANGSDIADLMQGLEAGQSLDTALAARGLGGLTQFEADFSANGANHFASETFDGTGSILDPSGTKSDAELIPDTPSTPSLFTYSWSASTQFSAATGPSTVKFQIGANEGQTLQMELRNLSTGRLGIGGVSVKTQSTASNAIKKFDEAIEKVSATRSTLGALQNRLEHTINNLGTATENLTAAESRIRDTDMSKEMMDFTKQNLLMQAAQSMLAQANQQPQGVLQLLS